MMETNSSQRICPINGETHAEEWANFLTHGFGLLLSIAGIVFLFSSALITDDPGIYYGCVIYSATLILMYWSSTIYHASTSPTLKLRLRTFDYICIYLLIAGSYTPFIFGPLKGTVGLTVCAVVWSTAFFGIILKIFYVGRFIVLSTILFLLMGWGSILIMDAIKESLAGNGFAWFLAGGISYTIGVVFFLWDSLPFNHSIWHLFVIGGSACHFHVITFYIAQ